MVRVGALTVPAGVKAAMVTVGVAAAVMVAL
jgi:hypothetical protein